MAYAGELALDLCGRQEHKKSQLTSVAVYSVLSACRMRIVDFANKREESAQACEVIVEQERMNAVMDAEVRQETEELDHRSLDTAAQHSDIGSVSSTAGTCDDSDGHVDLDFHPNLQRDPEEEGGRGDEAEARNSSVSLESQALEEFKDEGPPSDVIRRIMTSDSSSPAAYSSVSSRTPPRALDRPNRHIFLSQAAGGYDSGREGWENNDDDGNNGVGHYGPGAFQPMDGAAEGAVGGGFASEGQEGGHDSARTTLLCDIRSEPDGVDETERDVGGGSGDACSPAIELGPLLASSGVVRTGSPFRRRHNNSPLGMYSWQRDFGGETDVEGVTGLQNLGNTCFMNSALQCLSNTPPLRDYFLSGEYKKDINEDNKLGTGGELACEFGALIDQIWRGRHGWVAPRAFKRALGHHAEQFMGFDQQDAQELIAYLLDGIHEDLNKVSVKPYAESKVEAAAEQDDRETAERAWEQHKSRNDSKIVDIFQGQYKSVITCPDPNCSRISTIFDPFMYLSLPIPTVNETLIALTYFSADGSPPVRWGTNVPSDAKMAAVRTALAQHVGVPVTEIVLAERWNSGFYQIYENEKDASSTLNEDVVAFHVPTPWVAKFEMELAKHEGWEEKISAFLRNDRLHVIKRHDANLYNKLMHALECFDDWRVHDILTEPLTEESYDELERLLKLYDAARQLDQLHRRGVNPYILKVYCCRQTHGPYKHYGSCSFRTNSELGEPLIVGFEPGETKVGEVRRDILRRLRYRLRPCMGPSDACGGRGGVVEEEETKGEDLENMRESKVDEEEEKRGGSDVLCNGGAIGVGVGSDGEGRAIEGWMEDVAASWEFLFVNRETKDYKYIRARKGRVKAASAGNQLFNDDDDDDEDGTDDAGAVLDESEDLDVTVISQWEPGDNEILVEWPDDVCARHFDSRSERAFVTVDPGFAEVERKVKEGVSIYSCIELFQHKEQLAKTEAWRCPDCADFKEAWKELRLWKVPPILVLHLKRFQYEGWLRRKIDTTVTFPVKGLDLRPYVLNQSEDDPPIYDLYAVSNHSGGLTGGHYTACALNDVTAEWSSLDDSWTKQIEEDSVVSNEAYVLFYRRVSTYQSSPLPRPALEPDLKPHAEREGDEAQAKKSGAFVDHGDEEEDRDRLGINGRCTTNSPEPDHDDDDGAMRIVGLDGPDTDDDELFLDPTEHLNPQPKTATVDIRPEEKVLVKDDDSSSSSAPCKNNRKRASPLQIEDTGRRSRRMLDGEFKAVDGYEDVDVPRSSFEQPQL